MDVNAFVLISAVSYLFDPLAEETVSRLLGPQRLQSVGATVPGF